MNENEIELGMEEKGVGGVLYKDKHDRVRYDDKEGVTSLPITLRHVEGRAEPGSF